MSRTIITIAAAAMMSAALLLSPISASARRCDDKPPETLMSLYRKSAAIHIGRFERVEDFAIVEQGEDFTVVQVRKHYSISSTLKGTPQQSFFTQEDEYRYAETGADEEFIDEHSYGMVKLEPGDAVMLFTMADPETGMTVLTDYADAVKKLDADEMSAYTSRVEELNSLFAEGEPSEAAALRWILKAIEDPITRWEGAYELLSGVQYLEWKKDRDANIVEKTAKGEKIEEWELEDNYYYEDTFNNSGYAKLLSERDRQRLVDILVSSEPAPIAKDGEYSRVAEGEAALTDLVSRWADRRVADHLVSQIRRGGQPYYRMGHLMEIVAKALENSELRSLGEKYAEIYYEDDEPITAETGVQAPIDPQTGQPVKAATFGELRRWVLDRFLEKSDVLLTTASAEQPSN